MMEKQMTDKKISRQARAEAMKIARGTQRPGQKKEQTKLIAQGIEKGISEFRKREKAKARERDKHRKKALNKTNPAPPQMLPSQSCLAYFHSFALYSRYSSASEPSP